MISEQIIDDMDDGLGPGSSILLDGLNNLQGSLTMPYWPSFTGLLTISTMAGLFQAWRPQPRQEVVGPGGH